MMVPEIRHNQSLKFIILLVTWNKKNKTGIFCKVMNNQKVSQFKTFLNFILQNWKGKIEIFKEIEITIKTSFK